VHAFEAAALQGAVRGMRARPPAPVTMPDSLQAMQDATLSLYDELAHDRSDVRAGG
jgi:hypothetical protein